MVVARFAEHIWWLEGRQGSRRGKAGGDDESPRNSAVKPAKPGDIELAKVNNVNKLMVDAQKVEVISEGNKEGPDSENKEGPDSRTIKVEARGNASVYGRAQEGRFLKCHQPEPIFFK